ncbi:hypothetical protein LPJ55_000134 [Coemansia sp. RSA 990]|nr:hypothetical protein BX667DRAFT_514974 [Coemansia mojavensis]KAJ1744329.1 hypothetical protein LPJ68_000009 [Coemansia sp. RSA 1086]KAJ1753560.1 hypothetical protein LPJ79_000153 [Coemansia sp. RSA 1821]KAJ1876232.1 hypothetical protein LPJ55_000134 [Coemansia sp. RSA 990]KAJ2675788.1 hypothetical protein IWW42_000833 [Coemansia sp. RSA 1085]
MPYAADLVWLMKRADTNLLPDGTHEHPTESSEMKREVYLWVGVVDIFLFSVSTLLFVYRGRRTLDINAHAVLLTSIGSFTILVVNTCFLFQFVWPGKFPCFVILWCAYPGVMLWISCTMARAMRLYILSFRNMQKLKERNRAGQMTAAQLYGKGALHDSDSDNAAVDDHADLGAEGASTNPAHKLTFACPRVNSIRRWWANEKMQMTERRLVWYVLGSTVFSAIICAIIQALTKDLAIVPMQFAICPVGVWEYFPLYALTAFYCLLLTPIIVYHIWPIKDAFGIRHDILLNNLFTFVCIAMFMVQTNKGFGGHDPFWDSFLWCALLFNMSQFTSVILPLIRSYRQSDAFTWSDNSGRSASKELFYRVLNHPELFEKLKVYSAANFCTEITLFLEEYQVLKANTVRFYNIGEPGFDDDAGPEDKGDLDHEVHADSLNSSNPNLATVGNSTSAWANAAAAQNGSNATAEKDALRLHLNGNQSKHVELESNPDTIISVDNRNRSMSDVDLGNQAPMSAHSYTTDNMAHHAGEKELNSYSMGYGAHNIASKSSSTSPMAPAKAAFSSSRLGGILRGVFQKNSAGYQRSQDPSSSSTNASGDGASSSFDGISSAGVKPSNTATLAVGGAAIGNLPQRRNSRGEDIMVISHIPPFTPVRYTVLSTLMQTPAGMKRQGNMNTFKTLPFALRGDYYGFYSTFIADGATLQINVEGRISEAITRLIHSQQYTVDMMDEAHTEVLQLLYDNIFKKFVRIYHREMASIM